MAPLNVDLRKYYPICITIFALLLFFPGLGARDFWAPVEPRYGEIARIMFAKEEWIVPMVNGELYTDKPVLFFWIVLAAAKILGSVNEWTVRLPAALGGVGFVLATYFFGRDFFNARVGAIAAIVLATSFRVIWESRWAHIDMLFSWFFVLAIYFGARTVLRRAAPYEFLWVYAFMALATLAKGLIGIVLPALLFISFMLLRRDWRMLRAAKLELGIPVFLVIAGPWFYLVSHATSGDWLSDFIYIHHFQRYMTGVAHHHQPFYYYFTTLPVDFLPWTGFSIPALIARWPTYRRAWTEPHIQFCLLWFFTVFLFFTVSNSKRDLYLLPLTPTLALFVAVYLDELARRAIPPSAIFSWVTTLFFGIIALAGLTSPIAARIAWRSAFWPILPPSLVLAAGGGFTVALIRRSRPFAAAASVSVMMLLTMVAAVLWLFPYLEGFKSHRAFSLEIKRIVPAWAPLYVFSDSMHDFNFYTQREKIPVLTSAAQIESLRISGEKGYLLIKERDLRRLPDMRREWIIIGATIGATTWKLVDLQAANDRNKPPEPDEYR